MPDTQWFYARDNKQEGPVSEAELMRILTEQRLPPTTLLWAEHLDRWTAAKDIPEFQRADPSDVYTVAPRPWHRLIARLIDHSIYSIPYMVSCAILLSILNAIRPIDKDAVVFLVLLILTLLSPMPYVLESLLMGTLGNTPGKLLLNSRVLNEHGEKLSFLQALQRTGGVWVRGGPLVAYVPVFGFLGLLGLGVYQYTQLVTLGTVSWDRNQALLYEHGSISAARVGALIAVFIGLLIWFGVLSFSIANAIKQLGPG